MSQIRELSKSMINKIAAGEVVERPANVVKELVENSIDAGATRVEIIVEKSGSELVKIVDDGCGISADQLVLALSPHSTSKISETEDLFRIHTLGFRGEALASIAEVSQLVLRSRTADSSEGAQIRSDGGVFNEVAPCGCPVGTTIEARNLFFNVPARRKFLKSPTTEFGHISEAVVRVSLPRTGIRFILKHNDRNVYDLPATDGLKERIGRIFGADVASRLVSIESVYKNVKVAGFVGLPDLSRGSQSLQYLFLNGRYIRDRSLQHALTEAYRGLLVSGRYPVVFLNIETPPNFVDVNVHPSKLEVRFVDGQAIYAGVLAAIRDRFLRSDLTSRPNDAELDAAARRSQSEFAKSSPSPESGAVNSAVNSIKTDVSDSAFDASDAETPILERRFVPDVDVRDPIAALDANVAEERRRDVLDWFNEKSSSKNKNGASPAPPDKTSGNASNAEKNDANADSTSFLDDANAALLEASQSGSSELDAPPDVLAQRVERRDFSGAATPGARFDGDSGGDFGRPNVGALFNGRSEFRKFPPLPNSPFNSEALGELSASNTNAEPRQPNLERFANVEKTDSATFAFTSSGKPVVQICRRYLAMEANDGLALVDQHALHERILFERLKTNLSNGKLDSQRLLVPEVVDLAPKDLPIALENRELFADLGILIDGFGGNSVVINGYPAILRKASPTEIFLAALETVQTNRGKLERADLLDASLKQMSCKAAIKAGDVLRADAIAELIAAAEEELNAHHCPHGRPSTLVFSCREIDKLFKRQ